MSPLRDSWSQLSLGLGLVHKYWSCLTVKYADADGNVHLHIYADEIKNMFSHEYEGQNTMLPSLNIHEWLLCPIRYVDCRMIDLYI